MLKRALLILGLVEFFSLSGLTPYYEHMIKQIVTNNPAQLTYQEYECIAETILQHAPCNILVFGVGKDSGLWQECNADGMTIFIEDNQKWIDFATSRNPSIQIYKVSYGTRVEKWQELLNTSDRSVLFLELPEFIFNTSWNIIFIDGPAGAFVSSPGRMKSIYMASFLAAKGKGTHIFVHDCNRIVENIYSRFFLHDWNLKKQIDKLRHYYI